MTINELAPGIVVFENIFQNSMEYIKEIENNHQSFWRPAEVLINQNENKSGTNYNARDTDLISLPHHSNINEDLFSKMSRDFYNSTKPYIDKYLQHYGAKIEKQESPQLLRYGKDQRFHNHIDDHPFFTRRISLTYYLNDDYEGGDVEFKRFNIRFKAQKNQLLLFPSNFIYNHEVYPVTSGLRYVIVQWMA